MLAQVIGDEYDITNGKTQKPYKLGGSMQCDVKYALVCIAVCGLSWVIMDACEIP